MDKLFSADELPKWRKIFAAKKEAIACDIIDQLLHVMRDNTLILEALEKIAGHKENGSIYGSGLDYSYCALLAQKALQPSKPSETSISGGDGPVTSPAKFTVIDPSQNIVRKCPKCGSEVIGDGLYDANMDGNPVKFQECMKCDYSTKTSEGK